MLYTPSNIESLFVTHFSKLLAMIESNIFRPLPDLGKKQVESDLVDGISLQIAQDPQWPYLHGIYELFLHLIQLKAVHMNALCQLISQNFIHKLLDLFNS